LCLDAPKETGENFAAQTKGRILIRVHTVLNSSKDCPQASLQVDFFCVHKSEFING